MKGGICEGMITILLINAIPITNSVHQMCQHLQLVGLSLELVHAFGTVYHPQSQGKVELMNLNLKSKLPKICATTNMNWVDALPIAQTAIRSSTGFTPYSDGATVSGTGSWAGKLAHPPYYDQLSALVSSST